MKIYDQTSKRVLSNVTLFLTPAEMLELAGSADDLARNPQKHHHHISDATLEQDVTLAVYTPDNLDQFDEESRKVIEGES